MRSLYATRNTDTGGLFSWRCLSGYLVFSLGFSAASGVFLAAFIFLVLRTPISFSTIAGGMAGIAVFQLFGFGANLLLLRPLPIAQAEILLQQSMGRVALLYLAVFAGVCVAAFADRWFVIPFIALKAMVDIGGQVQGFNNLFRRNNSS
jgi:hypothetical protein